MGKSLQTLTGILNADFVDQCSDLISDGMSSWKVERRKALGIRIMVEEVLMKWMDGKGEGQPVEVTVNAGLRRYGILLKLRGEPQNPLFKSGAEDELDWGEGLLRTLGKAPQYAYKRGKNCIHIQVDKQKKPLRVLFLAIVLVLLVGGVGNLILPEDVRQQVANLFFLPIRDTFLRILSAIAGPVSFVSVLRAVCQLHQSAELGQAIRKYALRAIGITLLLTAVATVLGRILLVHGGVYRLLESTQLSQFFSLLLDFIPGDIVSPFLNNDSPRIIVLALVLGTAALTMGDRVSDIDEMVQNLERLLYVVIEWLSDLAPFFIFFILVRMMWIDSGSILYRGWIPLLCVAVVCVASVIWVCGLFCVRKRVSPRLLLKKLWPSFRWAVLTASSSDAYEEALRCCEEKLGVEPSITKVAMPIGLVIYMPATAVATALLTLYIADACGVEMTGTKLLVSILLSVGLSAAALPVPGSALTSYAVIFSYLAIPSDGLAAVLVLDTLLSFVTAGMNLLLLEMELVAMADRQKGLDVETLRS